MLFSRQSHPVGATNPPDSLLVLKHPCQAISALIMGHTNVSPLDVFFVSISMVVVLGGEFRFVVRFGTFTTLWFTN